VTFKDSEFELGNIIVLVLKTWFEYTDSTKVEELGIRAVGDPEEKDRNKVAEISTDSINEVNDITSVILELEFGPKPELKELGTGGVEAFVENSLVASATV
jgi:hypothetical protein